VFTVAIGRNPEMMENAAYRLLDMEMEDLKHHVERTGNSSKVVGRRNYLWSVP
jgi:hypothetical protein